MSQKITAVSEAFVQRLSDRLVAGEISLSDWQTDMREELRRVHALQLIAGAGGDPANVTADDWLKLGGQLRSQYSYLSDFGRGIQDGSVADGDIGRRSQMYVRSANETYWRQATAGADLPAYPGDGTTDCLSNCGCEWSPNADGSYTWALGTADNCATCLQRAREWAPYRSAN
jgi:hypothetical protein